MTRPRWFRHTVAQADRDTDLGTAIGHLDRILTITAWAADQTAARLGGTCDDPNVYTAVALLDETHRRLAARAHLLRRARARARIRIAARCVAWALLVAVLAGFAPTWPLAVLVAIAMAPSMILLGGHGEGWLRQWRRAARARHVLCRALRADGRRLTEAVTDNLLDEVIRAISSLAPARTELRQHVPDAFARAATGRGRGPVAGWIGLADDLARTGKLTDDAIVALQGVREVLEEESAADHAETGSAARVSS